MLDIPSEEEQPYDPSLCNWHCLLFLASSCLHWQAFTSCFWIPCESSFHSWLLLSYLPPHSAVPRTEISQEQVGRCDFIMTQKTQLEIASSFTPGGHSETQGVLCCLLHLFCLTLVVKGNTILLLSFIFQILLSCCNSPRLAVSLTIPELVLWHTTLGSRVKACVKQGGESSNQINS